MDIPVKECRSCNARIIWASVRKKDGTTGRMPFDADSVENGTHRLYGREYRKPDGTLDKVDVRAEWVPEPKRAGARASGVNLRVSHFATCPNAEQHRSAK